MHKPHKDLRLGLWRIHVLHEASHRPVWGNMLVRVVAERGHHVPSSIMHDAIAFMIKKGWLTYADEPAPGNANQVRLTPSGKTRLDKARADIASLHRELQASPTGATNNIAAELEALLERNKAEVAMMRAALLQLQGVLANALD